LGAMLDMADPLVLGNLVDESASPAYGRGDEPWSIRSIEWTMERSAQGVTSKASMTTQVSVEVTFAAPSTSTVKVCGPRARPSAVNTVAWSCGLGAYVSIVPFTAPSTETRAMPTALLRKPMRRTAVPVKLNVSELPAGCASANVSAV